MWPRLLGHELLYELWSDNFVQIIVVRIIGTLIIVVPELVRIILVQIIIVLIIGV